MQYQGQIKSGNKKLYPNPSAINLSTKFKAIPEINSNNKFTKFRRTDYTDDKNSQMSNSQMQQGQPQPFGRVSQQAADNYASQSRASKNTRYSQDHIVKILGQKQQKIIELRERLKNIHHFYKIRIDEERNKNIQRNQVFIGVIEQLQRSHNEKVLAIQKSFQQMEDDKRQIGLVDERMVNIKTHIQDILKKSQDLKANNQKLQKQILKRQIVLKEKQEVLMSKKEELDGMRQKLQQFQRLKLKENKRTKELMQMIDNVF